LNNRPITCQ